MKSNQFYEKPDSGNGKAIPDAGDSLMLNGYQDIDQFIANSPKLDLGNHPKVNQDMINDPVAPTPGQQEQPAPTVTPQVTPQQPPDQTQPQQQQAVYEFAGEQLTQQQLEQAIMDSRNKQKWQANLTQEAQEISFLKAMDPETREKFRNEVLLYAYKKKDFKPQEVKTPDKFSFEYKDKDNYSVDVELTADHPVIKKAMDLGYQKAKAEFGDSFETLTKTKQEVSQFEEAYRSQVAEFHLRQVINHPAIDIKIPEGESVQKSLEMIMQAGKTNPMFAKVQRLMDASELAGVKKITIQEALDRLYGEYVTAPQNLQQRKQNLQNLQRTGLPIVPGQAPAAPSSSEEFLSDLKNTPSAQVQKILEGFM